MNEQLNERFLTLRKQHIAKQFGRLNEMQQDAVYTTEGPLLILAGAGSGKTTVLVNRIANMVRFGSAYAAKTLPFSATQEDVSALEQLVAQGGEASTELLPKLSENAVRPYHILAITFTNKAAGELKLRLQTMLGEAGQDINASTFHSACVRILRREAERLGYPKSFTIYDSDDQQRTMKEVFKLLNVDDKFLPVRSAIGAIGRLKDKMISPAMALAVPQDSRAGLVAKVYDLYQKRLVSAGALDFDDLIYQTVRLLQDFEEVRTYYQNRFRYILVDEYQDTSVAQFKLVYLLGSAHNNVCVVGDDDQSIYRFRGATIENILNFEKTFQGAKVIRLEQNYRSTSTILDAANCVIKHNTARKGKKLWTENDDGERIIHYAAESEFDEAAHIATLIGRNLRKGAKLRDHAILYRMNAQSGPIETYFARAGIPYKIVGG
ncbi:MAG: UvrD-helicase domain-containing protein, partial [Ruthenibacterium sp.]